MKVRVLLNEEDDSVQKSLCRALRSKGCAVAAAKVSEFCEDLWADGADVVVIDADTPTGNGWAMATKAAAALHGRPLVMLTAEPGQLRRALAAGANVLLEKPVAVPALLEAIEQLLVKRTPGGIPTATPSEPQI